MTCDGRRPALEWKPLQDGVGEESVCGRYLITAYVGDPLAGYPPGWLPTAGRQGRLGVHPTVKAARRACEEHAARTV